MTLGVYMIPHYFPNIIMKYQEKKKHKAPMLGGLDPNNQARIFDMSCKEVQCPIPTLVDTSTLYYLMTLGVYVIPHHFTNIIMKYQEKKKTSLLFGWILRCTHSIERFQSIIFFMPPASCSKPAMHSESGLVNKGTPADASGRCIEISCHRLWCAENVRQKYCKNQNPYH